MKLSKKLQSKRKSLKEFAEEEVEKRCRGKVCYRTKGFAVAMAGRVNKTFPEPNKQEAYKCAFGKHYHLGHHPRVHVDRQTLRELKTALS